MSVGNGAPEQVGWKMDFLVMFLCFFLYFLDGAPPKFGFLTRKSKSQAVHAIGVGYVLGRECTFRVSLVGLVEKLFDFFVGEILQMFFWQRFLFRDFWVGMFPQTVFRFLLELAWKRFLFKVCLVAHFSTDIFG